MIPRRARAILAVGPDASPDEIEASFRRAIRGAHPDHGGEPGRAQLLLDARRCLRGGAAPSPTADRCVVVVPAPTLRDHLSALFARLPPHRRPTRVR